MGLTALLLSPAAFVLETCKLAVSLVVEVLYEWLLRFAFSLVERNLVPDFLLRKGIRFLLAARLKELKAPTGEEQHKRLLVRPPRASSRPSDAQRAQEYVADLKARVHRSGGAHNARSPRACVLPSSTAPSRSTRRPRRRCVVLQLCNLRRFQHAFSYAFGSSLLLQQHYEVPTEFYLLCLGKHLKYRRALD